MPAREVGGAATLHDCLDTVTHYNYTGANAEMDAKLAAKIVNSNADLPPGGPLAPGVPVNLTATAAGTSQVNVTWSASSGSVDHYEIERKSAGGSYTWVGIAVAPATAWTDSSVGSGTAYVYRVKAVGPSSAASDYSNVDLATTVIFTDDRLVAGQTDIKGVHLTELRTAVNAVRSCAGLAGATWTDPIITATETLVQAVHVQELRGNLNSARIALGLAAQTWTDPTLTVGETEVKKVHFDELRQGVK